MKVCSKIAPIELVGFAASAQRPECVSVPLMLSSEIFDHTALMLIWSLMWAVQVLFLLRPSRQRRWVPAFLHFYASYLELSNIAYLYSIFFCVVDGAERPRGGICLHQHVYFELNVLHLISRWCCEVRLQLEQESSWVSSWNCSYRARLMGTKPLSSCGS